MEENIEDRLVGGVMCLGEKELSRKVKEKDVGSVTRTKVKSTCVK